MILSDLLFHVVSQQIFTVLDTDLGLGYSTLASSWFFFFFALIQTYNFVVSLIFPLFCILYLSPWNEGGPLWNHHSFPSESKCSTSMF